MRARAAGFGKNNHIAAIKILMMWHCWGLYQSNMFCYIRRTRCAGQDVSAAPQCFIIKLLTHFIFINKLQHLRFGCFTQPLCKAFNLLIVRPSEENMKLSKTVKYLVWIRNFFWWRVKIWPSSFQSSAVDARCCGWMSADTHTHTHAHTHTHTHTHTQFHLAP